MMLLLGHTELELSMNRLVMMLMAAVVMSSAAGPAHANTTMQTFPVQAGAGPHDVYPAPDGAVWFTAQSAGKLGRLDPRTGKLDLISLGPGAAPHGVIVGPDGDAWITEGGQNAIARVDPATRAVKLFPLPKDRRDANLNTATFDRQGVLWFTGQNGIYGRLDPKSGAIAVFDAPRGIGPYGISTTPDGQVFFASLAGSYLGQIDLATGNAIVLEPPVPRQGARRVWSDSHGALWITGWNSGDLFATTARPGVGHAGTCLATAPSPMPSMSTRPMRCGSATGAPTRSCASTPGRRNSSPFHYPIATQTCANSPSARAKSGVLNPAPTSSSCSRPSR
jgi:streptogramin lyase